MRRYVKPTAVAVGRSATLTGEPFDLVGDDEVGVVLVHGFTGTPYEVRYLGVELARDGFTVRAPLLPGHGTSIDDLDRTRWEDWAEAVERAVDALRVRCGRVAVVGQSLGGLLALHVGSQRKDVFAVGSLAAPLWLDGLSGKVARWTQGPLARLKRLPMGGRFATLRFACARPARPGYT